MKNTDAKSAPEGVAVSGGLERYTGKYHEKYGDCATCLRIAVMLTWRYILKIWEKQLVYT